MRRLLGSLAVLLVVPATAGADLRADRVGASWRGLAAGPVLAGDDVLWAQQSGGASARAFTLWRAAPGVGRVALTRWDAPAGASDGESRPAHLVAALDGSAGGVALWRATGRLRSEDVGGGPPEPIFEARAAELHTGPSAGPLGILATVERDDRCVPSPDAAGESVAVDGDVIATVEPVCTDLAERAGRHELVVRTAGDRRVLAAVPSPAQAIEAVRVSGRHVAWLHTRRIGRARRVIHVADVVTGATVQVLAASRLPLGVIDDFDVGRDGSVTFSVYPENEHGRLYRARPGQRRARRLRFARGSVHPDGLRVAGSRVLYVRTFGRGRELVVADKRRPHARRVVRMGAYDPVRFDLDADQVAYAGRVRKGKRTRGGVFVARLP